MTKKYLLSIFLNCYCTFVSLNVFYILCCQKTETKNCDCNNFSRNTKLTFKSSDSVCDTSLRLWWTLQKHFMDIQNHNGAVCILAAYHYHSDTLFIRQI